MHVGIRSQSAHIETLKVLQVVAAADWANPPHPRVSNPSIQAKIAAPSRPKSAPFIRQCSRLALLVGAGTPQGHCRLPNGQVAARRLARRVQ
jgi:hypothetical protein